MVNGPKLWDQLLKACPSGSILMGGAVVDFILNIKPQDFDIYMSLDQADEINYNKNWVYQGIAGNPDVPHEYGTQDKDGKNPICSVANWAVIIEDDIVKVQTIALDMPDPVKFFKSFDHSLTKGLYNKQGMYINKCVFESMNNKTVKLLNPHNPARALERAKNKVKRYDPLGADNWQYLNF